MADYWLKLYTEILDDPKMALLPHKTWRRVIEMFLISKDTSNDGYLPDIETIAWRLRVSPREIKKDMESLLETGIILQQDGRYYIKNFIKRQSASTNAERQKQYKERKKVTDDVQPCNESLDEFLHEWDEESNEIGNEIGDETLPERYQESNEIGNEIGDETLPERYQESNEMGNESANEMLPQSTELRDRVKRTEKRLKDLTDQPEKTPADGNIKIPKPQKHKYGEFKNVLLTDDELRKYQEKNPYDWQQRIERMSSGIEMKGYKYSSHYLALLNWDRNEKSRNSVLPNQNSQQGSQQRGVLGMNFVDIVTGRDQ